MLSPGKHVIWNFVVILYFAKGNVLLKDEGTKDFDRDFQMCMKNFVVNTDIIIRTQDSRKLGAKYLNDMDVESRYDCKRFCCETDMCDVFVYEEKKPGSCYLFHCGPPHDFKCKFTNHTSYSSAILTIANPQQTLQIEEQIRRIKQEHELKSLRKMSESASLEYPMTDLPPVVITQMPKSPAPTTPVVNKTICSRNQYECTSTRECIAIYNVCDGIPQCADGSDESEDLGCPTEKSPSVSQPLLPRPLLPVEPDVSNYQQIVPHHKSYASIYKHGMAQENLKSWKQQQQNHQILTQQQNLQYPMDRNALVQPQVNNYPRYQWNYPLYYDPTKDNYGNMNIPQEQEKLPYEQDQSRIFHHKRPGMTNENGERNLYENRPYVPYYIPANHEGWSDGQPMRMNPQEEIQGDPNSLMDPQGEIIQPEIPAVAPTARPETRPAAHSEVRAEIPKPKSVPQPIMKIEPHPTVAPQVIPTQIPPIDKTMMKQDNLQSQNKPEEKQTEKPQVTAPKETQHTAVNKKEETQPAKAKAEVYHVPSHRKIEEKTASIAEHFRLEDEEERMRPRGAVISLALGLTVTAIMAVLIACRLRVVRRRGRRRHEPYAHDADYLVNGMYL